MQFQFSVPKVTCAPGASKNVGQLALAGGCRNILCIYDKGVKNAGLVEPIVEAMKEAGLTVSEFDQVQPDPPIEVIEKAVEAARQANADGVVGIGGGSALDTAKLAAALTANREPIQTYYELNSMKEPAIPLFTIPTTSGTGSEVTPAAVVSDPQLGRKITLVAAQLTPAWAVLDPLLTKGLPPAITASTGMDALSHAMESITCIRHNPMTDGIALTAVKLIARYLPECVRNGQNEEARAHMMIAATMAGMAFGNTPTHVGHALAHAMGAKWHIPHGAACALALPFAMENCGEIAKGQVAQIADALGIFDSSLTAAEQAEKVAAWVEEFSDSIGISSLRELGGKPEELDEIVEMSLNEKPLILLSGAAVTEEACRAYYQRLFER